MDVKKFKNARDEELANFRKQHAFLKREYSTALSAAIKETDPAAQASLISRIQQLNIEMSQELRGILISVSKDTDSKTIDELTEELIKYQKDYKEIEQSHDKVITLRMIRGTTHESLNSAKYMYYGLLAALILACLTIPFILFRNAFTTSSILPQSAGAFPR